MKDTVYESLQNLIISNKYDSAAEIINELLEKHKDLSLSDIAELKKLITIQLENDCNLKHFL